MTERNPGDVVWFFDRVFGHIRRGTVVSKSNNMADVYKVLAPSYDDDPIIISGGELLSDPNDLIIRWQKRQTEIMHAQTNEYLEQVNAEKPEGNRLA